MMANDDLFILTGGPGAGKTTLLLELERRGFRSSPEVARQIIQEQVAANGDALPWANTKRYTELMLERSIEAHRKQSASTEIVFMDRGIPDVACYARLIGIPFAYDLKPYRCNRLVFVAPPWREIYATDAERKQTFAEAIATYETMVAVYEEYGYEPVVLPRVSPQKRADFVLDRIMSEKAGFQPAAD